MKYDEKYPLADTHQWEKNGVVKIDQSSPCAVCKEETVFADLSWQCHICSDECEQTMMIGFMRADVKKYKRRAKLLIGAVCVLAILAVGLPFYNLHWAGISNLFAAPPCVMCYIYSRKSTEFAYLYLGIGAVNLGIGLTTIFLR